MISYGNARRSAMIGNSDFKKLRDRNGYYVDKTALVDAIYSKEMEVYLFTRPRRFGKTLNMSMLDAYFNEKYKGNAWFNGLRISELIPEDPRKNSCTVIFLSMKDLRSETYEGFLEMIGWKMGDLYGSFPELRGSARLDDSQKMAYHDVWMRSAGETALKNSLSNLAKMLTAEHGRRVVLLIDEYDNAVNEAESDELRRKILGFMSTFLSSALKDNSSLDFAVVTGVMQIAKASIFSGVNNLYVNSVFDSGFDEFWGFTEDEVRALCADFGDASRFEEAKEWYDGYRFGNADVYNPWSVLNYVQSGFVPKPYWSNTSTNSILGKMYRSIDTDNFAQILSLLSGESFRTILRTSFTYEDAMDDRSMYSLMAMAGYLKVEPASGKEFDVSFPNKEVASCMEETVEFMMTPSRGTEFKRFCSAIIDGRIDEIERILSYILRQGSYLNLKDENCYELVVMTVLYGIAHYYRIRTEQEWGNGRIDIMMEPIHNGMVPIIIELKKSDKETDLEKDANEGLAQIHEKRYYMGMKGTVLLYSISFWGKVPFVMHERMTVDAP